MNFKKVVALSICAAMVAGMSMSTVMAADLPDQFKDLKANEAYEFPMMVKSFQSTYWDAAQEGMKKAAEELGVTYTPQGPNSESDIRAGGAQRLLDARNVRRGEPGFLDFIGQVQIFGHAHVLRRPRREGKMTGRLVIVKLYAADALVEEPALLL